MKLGLSHEEKRVDTYRVFENGAENIWMQEVESDRMLKKTTYLGTL